MISKAKLYSSSFAHVEHRIYQDEVKRGLHFIELSKGRCVRRVLVDARTAETVRQGSIDVILLKEIRTALQFVVNQAKEQETQAARVAARRR